MADGKTAKLNQRSMKNLNGVHDDLVRVVLKAAETTPFLVTEGLRSKERQLALVKAGKSQTKNSRHLYGLAVDLCDTDGCYDMADMKAIARAMKAAAAALDVPIVWGGDWKSFCDTPHFELDRKHYPDSGAKKPFVLKPGTVPKVIGASLVATGVNQAAPQVPDVAQAVDLSGVASIVQALGPALLTPWTVAAVAACVVYYFGLPWLAGRVQE